MTLSGWTPGIRSSAPCLGPAMTVPVARQDEQVVALEPRAGPDFREEASVERDVHEHAAERLALGVDDARGPGVGRLLRRRDRRGGCPSWKNAASGSSR